MIIFINGSFGIGKSSVAEYLISIIPNSMLFDAEEVGYMLHKIYKPIDNTGDFQDVPIWRDLTVTTAQLLQKQYNRALVMPLCVWNEQYFTEIVSNLIRVDAQFYHFCLTADAKTILHRQNQRNDPPHVTEWIHARVEKCIAAHRSSTFEQKISTEGKSIKEIGNNILSYIPQNILHN